MGGGNAALESRRERRGTAPLPLLGEGNRLVACGLESASYPPEVGDPDTEPFPSPSAGIGKKNLVLAGESLSNCGVDDRNFLLHLELVKHSPPAPPF